MAKTPDVFGMQKPLDEQQLDAIVQNLKTAVDAEKSDYLWFTTLINGVTIASGVTIAVLSKQLIEFIKYCMKFSTEKAKQPIKEYMGLSAILLLAVAQAAKGGYDIYNSETLYRVTHRQANVYPSFILRQLLSHPALQDDTTQQALKDALEAKTKS